jgi:hypothetical protein
MDVIDESEFSGLLDSSRSLRKVWNILLNRHYVNEKKLKSNNRGWKTAEEIKVLLPKIEARERYEEARRKKESKRKKAFGSKSKLPQDLIDLQKYARNQGGFDYTKDKWGREVVDGHEFLTRTKCHKKTGVVTVVRMIPIEESYDFLMKIHVELGHTGGTALVDYIVENKVTSWPRDLVNCFPLYCLCCRQREKNRLLKKKVTMQSTAKDEIMGGNDVLLITTIPFPAEKTFTGSEFIVIAVYEQTEYLICRISEQNEMEEIVGEVSNDLVHTGFPTKVYFTDAKSSTREVVSLQLQSTAFQIQYHLTTK